MHFAKSLLIAVSATGTSAGAVAIAGFLTNSGPLSPGNPTPFEEEIAPATERVIIMDPVPIDRRGYDLQGTKPDDQIYVSVELLVRRKAHRKDVCNLMPRLRAAVLRDLGPRFWRSRTGYIDEGQSVDRFVQASFSGALGVAMVERVTVRFVTDRRQAPKSNCKAAVHGVWQTWIKMQPFKR